METKAKTIILVCLYAGLLSCSEPLKVVPYTYTKIFTGETSKTWKFAFIEQTLNGKVVETFKIDCASDDKYIFHNNPEHEYESVSGSKKCNDPAEDATITDTWTFTNASGTLTMILPFFDPTSPLPFIVLEAKKNSMELEIFIDQEATQSYRLHFTSDTEN